MTDIVAKGRDLYAALAVGDVATLRRLLSDTFQGQLSEGLPHELGRRYDGLEAMTADGWGSVGLWFDMRPEVQELVDGGDVLIGRGDYVGVAKPTGRPVRAAFAHFWRFDGEQFTGVAQITDTGMWRDALDGE